MIAEARLKQFREIAQTRKVDTTDDRGINGYRGTEYKVGKLIYMKLLVFNRFADPYPDEKFVYGSRRVNKKQFVELFEKQLQDGKIEVQLG